MICGNCGSGWVEWQGPLINLTHTFCKSCGAVNAHIDETDMEPDPDDYLDSVTHWPAIDMEGREVEANFDSEYGEGFIRGRLVKVDEIDDEGECPEPVILPLWHVVMPGAEVSWLDVISFRYVSDPTVRVA